MPVFLGIHLLQYCGSLLSFGTRTLREHRIRHNSTNSQEVGSVDQWYDYPDIADPPWELPISYKPTIALIAVTIGGTEVNATVMIPKRAMDSDDNAAALGSETNSNAVAIAEELAPSVTPLVI
jgi:hypothetical protein